jgi:DNA (cytosine-5)-methyltransferase 1
VASYYNEFDPFAAQWLRELIKAGLIADGEVDERSITDVQADDLRGFTQCHFFAGIGGWSYALRLAGWPDDRPIWTGSCPCQPFSGAGLAHGVLDKRHLWPTFQYLISECVPTVVFGEQVESRDGREWLTGVRADLEDMGYAVGSADLCAAGVGAPQIRQRLYWVADRASRQTRCQESADSVPVYENPWEKCEQQAGRCCSDHERHLRRTKPGVRIVADGISINVARLSAIGNAIVPQVAQAFIESYLEATA